MYDPTNPGYGQQPQQPLYPGQGQPSQQPYPSYGQPQPSQSPYPGSQQPSQHPYPGYAPSQQPYPTYGQPSQQPYVYPPPPTNTTQPKRGLIVGIVAAVLVVAVVAVGLIHYFGPTGTVSGFLNDIYIAHNASSAYSRLCSDAQAQLSESQLQSEIDALNSAGVVYDLSGVTYTLVDENFFGLAHVRLGGIIAATVNGQRQSVPITGASNAIATLQSSGFGWCITSNNLRGVGGMVPRAPSPILAVAQH
jgi:hypothetical protein